MGYITPCADHHPIFGHELKWDTFRGLFKYNISSFLSNSSRRLNLISCSVLDSVVPLGGGLMMMYIFAMSGWTAPVQHRQSPLKQIRKSRLDELHWCDPKIRMYIFECIESTSVVCTIVVVKAFINLQYQSKHSFFSKYFKLSNHNSKQQFCSTRRPPKTCKTRSPALFQLLRYVEKI